MNAQTPAMAAACPGCLATPTEPASPPGPQDARLVLSLPGIHCQGCIASVERALTADPRVRGARVNLTLKRALIDAVPGTQPADLIPLLATAGYEAHELDPGALQATETDRDGRALLTRLAVAGFASMNVMLLSVSVWAGASDATRDMFHWVSAAIAFPAVIYAGQPFFVNAWSALRARRLNMDVPIVLALVLALLTSLWETALSGAHAYFDAALALTFFLLAGRYLDHRTRAMARSAAQELTALEVPRALRVDETGATREVPVSALAVGDLVRVRPGGRMPVDGIVVEGRSELDRSLLTGETRPVFAGPEHPVSAGEVNLTGPLTLRATAVGQDTSLHRLADLVAVAESGRARYSSLADKAAQLYAPGVHILAGLAFLGWLAWSGDMRVALNIAAAVLIITCPCALGLAVPAVTTAASGRLFRQGLLVKHATALERLAEVDTVVFDKTGTLTAGAPHLVDAPVSPRIAGVARALAEASGHPLSQALAAGLRGAGQDAVNLDGVVEHPGFGCEADWQGLRVRLGRGSWVGADPEAEGSHTATYLRIGAEPPVAFRFQDSLRPGAENVIAALRAQGKAVAILSGDTEGAVRAFAGRLGIDTWQSGMLPAEKAEAIRQMTNRGHKVLMVGDGLNDTAALTAAHVSISPASALDAARVASDIVLLGQDLSPVAGALEIAGRATRRIRENFRIATFYNIVAVPLAVAGFATPLIAALAMSTSSVTVSLNALRLGRGVRKP
ncbi:MAG: heavy metal translocating P-type ATPase [Rhodobacteraceae bacterium]|nr:heavy metal translocating P-type ATPase [Paracoccaceae bacterium]